jgi:hypothetical protein
MPKKFRDGDKVWLKGTKTAGLQIHHIISRHYDISDLPWSEKITGRVELRNHSIHRIYIYDVRIDPKWQHYFEYRVMSFAEDDLLFMDEHKEYLEEELFEI